MRMRTGTVAPEPLLSILGAKGGAAVQTPRQSQQRGAAGVDWGAEWATCVPLPSRGLYEAWERRKHRSEKINLMMHLASQNAFGGTTA